MPLQTNLLLTLFLDDPVYRTNTFQKGASLTAPERYARGLDNDIDNPHDDNKNDYHINNVSTHLVVFVPPPNCCLSSSSARSCFFSIICHVT